MPRTRRTCTRLATACRPDFDPPLHWNELYNLGWRCGDNAPLQTRAQLETRRRSPPISALRRSTSIPTWDIAEGIDGVGHARAWVRCSDFVRTLRERHGLSLSLHLMMHTTVAGRGSRDLPARRRGGTSHRSAYRTDLYPNARVCCGSPAWKELKKQRLLRPGGGGRHLLHVRLPATTITKRRTSGYGNIGLRGSRSTGTPCP